MCTAVHSSTNQPLILPFVLAFLLVKSLNFYISSSSIIDFPSFGLCSDVLSATDEFQLRAFISMMAERHLFVCFLNLSVQVCGIKFYQFIL